MGISLLREQQIDCLCWSSIRPHTLCVLASQHHPIQMASSDAAEADALEGFFNTQQQVIDSNKQHSQTEDKQQEADRDGESQSPPVEQTANNDVEEQEGEEEDEEEDEEDDVVLVLNNTDVAGASHIIRPYSHITIKTKDTKQKQQQQKQQQQQQQSQQPQQQQPQDGQASSSASASASSSSGAVHPFRLPFPNESLYSLDVAGMADKPWRRPGADITDWFNYGFDEETWRVYCSKQIQQRMQNKHIQTQRAAQRPEALTGDNTTTSNGTTPTATQTEQTRAQTMPPPTSSTTMVSPPTSRWSQIQVPPQLPGMQVPAMPPAMTQRPFIPPPFVPGQQMQQMQMQMPPGMPGGHPPGAFPQGGPMPMFPPPFVPPPHPYGQHPGPPPGGAYPVPSFDPNKRPREERDDGRGAQLKRERI